MGSYTAAMDDIVKAALKKWPNVPHCYDWLALDARGQLFWNGKEIAAEALAAELKALGQSRPEAELQLAIDKAVPYGRVAELLDQLQAAKLSRVAFATAPAASAP